MKIANKKTRKVDNPWFTLTKCLILFTLTLLIFETVEGDGPSNTFWFFLVISFVSWFLGLTMKIKRQRDEIYRTG